MSPSAILRTVIAVGVIALSTFFVVTKEPNLGLDLEGGTQIVLETQSTDRLEATPEATDRVIAVLRQRVDALGVSEPTLARSGDRRIIVELPGVQDPREAAETIGQTAQLNFHAVKGVAGPQQEAKGDQTILPAEQGGERLILAPPALTGQGVSGADAVTDESGQWRVDVDFQGEGTQSWAQLTGEAACFQPGDPRRRIAIALDNEIISSPQVVDSQCNVGQQQGSTSITGDFTAEEAQELAILIEGGALPLPVEVISQSTVGATLGDQAIEASFLAGVIGIVLTGLFIIAVYRLMGALATLALASYALISYGALLGLGATLTLPGLAGFVLAIGMAIDANVLVFERAREEYAARESRGLRTALQIGFNKAWSAIIDSNVTTLLAAALLFFLASGPVRGFGVTLSIGVLASMISALIIARALTEWVASTKVIANHPKVTGVGHISKVRQWLEDARPYILRKPVMWVVISAAAVVVALGGVVTRGIDLGVEFTGGRVVQYSSTEAPIDVQEAREIVSDAGYPRAVVQQADDGEISVRTEQISNNEQVQIEQELDAGLDGETTKERDELIGPSLGDELRRNAMIALGVALLAQMAYLAVRFRWTYSVAAVLAMIHDVVLVVGIFAWLGKPIDGVFLAAALSIIGLSVNDTVVVFDRIREGWRAPHGRSFGEVANLACLQTIPRTVNTGLGAMFILAALAVLGGDSLKDFAIALLLGLVIGTYSSVFTAAPIAILLQPFAKERVPGTEEDEKRRRKVDPYGGGTKDDSGAVI